MMKKTLLLCLLFVAPLLRATTISLTLDPPTGALTGAPGQTVGWGFTISNTGTDFLVVTSSDFCVGPITSPCSNTVGTYTDFTQFNFFVVGPAPESSSVSQTFNSGAQTGTGSFLIDPVANIGDSAVGQIVITYDLFSVSPNDPSFDPAVDGLSFGNMLTSDASVTVAAPTVPEPSSLLLLGAGLVGWLGSTRRKPKL